MFITFIYVKCHSNQSILAKIPRTVPKGTLHLRCDETYHPTSCLECVQFKKRSRSGELRMEAKSLANHGIYFRLIQQVNETLHWDIHAAVKTCRWHFYPGQKMQTATFSQP